MEISPTTQKKDWNYRLVRYFLKNTQLTAMLLLFVTIAGLFAFSRFRVEGFPEINISLAVVNTVVPGAGPESINTTVTIPLENKLKDVKGLKEISSTSRNSVSTILLTFEEGTDMTAAVQDARTKISQASLPQGVQDPDIILPETGGAPYIVAVTGTGSLKDLSDRAEVFKEQLMDLSEVKSVELVSNAKQVIYIDVDPKGAALDYQSQLQAGTLSFPVGQARIDGHLTPLSSKAVITDLSSLKKYPITVQGQNGAQVQPLQNLANVYEGTDYGGQIHWLGYKKDDKFISQKALLYQIRLEKTADLLRTDEKVKTAIEESEKKLGNGSDVVVVYDQAVESRRQVKEIVEGAIGGKWTVDNPIANVGYVFGAIWLLLIVMLLFLDFRSAIISVLAVPLSFFFTFIFLNLFGVQLNTIVLFSLVLVLGLIADPAIVVLESIKRYMDLGYKGNQAVGRSVQTIGQGIFIAVLTSAVVFIPFALVSGTFGAIIKYIPLTVIPALIASYFVPMVFLTWFAGKFLKPSRHPETESENDISILWPVARWFVSANRYILARRWLSILIIILGLVVPVGISGYLFSSGKIRQVQFAEPDDNQFITVTIPTGSNLTEAELIEKSDALEKALEPYRTYAQSYFYGSLDGSGSDGASLSVTLTLLPHADRELTSKEIAQDLNSDLRSKFGELAQASEIGTGPPSGSFPISVRVFNPDSKKLLEVSKKVADELKTYSEVNAIRYDGQDKTTEFSIALLSDSISTYSVTPPVVYGQIAAVFGERTVLTLNGTDVKIRVPKDLAPQTLEDLKKYPIFTQKGPVTLETLAEVKQEEVPTAIRRLQGERYAEIGARINDSRDAINVQRKINDWTKSQTSAFGLDDKAFENRAGQDEFEKSFQELFLAIAIAIIFTYIIFVLFFKSFLQPLIILFAVPLIFIGVFPSLVWLNGGQFGFLETIGLIMVIGIVENVGIFLIDFANKKVAEGMDKKEAISLASGIRFRPIILTKLTALAGFLPLAVFAPFWRGLAVVAMMGILSSGILSLFTTPILYSWLTRKRKPKTEIEL
jgi:HAE1 family hydrophobic/amphiphilic exporter-1